MLKESHAGYSSSSPKGRMIFAASDKGAAVFQAAQRHSQRVKKLKTALPVLAVIMGAVFSWFTFFATPAPTLKIDLGNGVESGKLIMAKPNLNGFTKANRPYNMTADKATQDINQSGVITLEGMRATLPVGETGEATVTASSGVYDNANGLLRFEKDLSVTTNDGLEAKLRSAEVSIGSGQIKTDKPVDIKKGGTQILADRMVIEGNGDMVVFDGNVHLLMEGE